MGSSLFFFQAEDGIRDGRVTGVQTCALPIWQPRNNEAARRASTGASDPLARTEKAYWSQEDSEVLSGQVLNQRSEERRVGKECRSRRSPEQQKKKKKREADSAQEWQYSNNNH